MDTESTARWEGGNLIVQTLAERGVERIFSVSGGPLNSIYSATVGSPVQVVHTRHEGGAGFMAEASARISGIPGVCLVTLGPGVTNSMTTILTAHLGGTPLLVLAGQVPLRSLDRGAGMSFDPLPVVSPITKWAARILDTDRIPEYLDAAWRHMLSGRPGPVFLELPSDVLTASASPDALERRPWGGFRGPGLAAQEELALRACLDAAHKVVLLAGDDVRWSCPEGLLQSAVEGLHVPVFLLRMARGQIHEGHPLCAGPGYVGANPALRRALGEADCVLLIGHDFEFDLDFGQSINPTATIIQSHPEASLLGKNQAADLALNARSDSVLNALCGLPTLEGVDRNWSDAVAAAWRSARQEWLAEGRRSPMPMHPVRMVELVSEAMPADTVYVSSHGNIDFWADAILQMGGPNLYLRAGQSGSLGSEIPYGVGAKLARAHNPVVVFVGDGGFAFHGFELETAARYNAPVIVVVADDARWGAIAMPQMRAYGVEVEMDLPRRSWANVAESIGCRGLVANDEDQLRSACQLALESSTPVVIQVEVASVESPYMRYTSTH